MVSNMGVTNRCRLSWLTNSALVYEPKCGGWGAEGYGVSANEYIQLFTWSPNKLWRSNSIFNLLFLSFFKSKDDNLSRTIIIVSMRSRYIRKVEVQIKWSIYKYCSFYTHSRDVDKITIAGRNLTF